MTERDYLDLFQGDGAHAECKITRALNRAHETRKFEIELDWKRATYFWIFIAALFSLFGALFSLVDPFNPKYSEFLFKIEGRVLVALCVVAITGFVTSYLMLWNAKRMLRSIWSDTA